MTETHDIPKLEIEVSSLSWSGNVIMMCEFPLLPYFTVADIRTQNGMKEGTA